jgi:hypothetical protein
MEQCESRVNNLLASLSNLPDKDVKGKLAVLAEILEAQENEIEKLKAQAEWIPEILASDGRETFKATSLEIHQSSETHTWFRVKGRQLQKIETLPLKGEI